MSFYLSGIVSFLQSRSVLSSFLIPNTDMGLFTLNSLQLKPAGSSVFSWFMYSSHLVALQSLMFWVLHGQQVRLSELYVLFDLLLPFQYLTFSAFYDLISCKSLWREVGCRSVTQTTTAVKAVSVSETTRSAEFYSPVCIVSSGPFKPLWAIVKHTCFIIAFSD